ncbi:MAG: putative viral replication protein [Cressdnaviricota sp.]|nr:MAG: putative viral replication protein [Cressdnaviricota sp.]
MTIVYTHHTSFLPRFQTHIHELVFKRFPKMSCDNNMLEINALSRQSTQIISNENDLVQLDPLPLLRIPTLIMPIINHEEMVEMILIPEQESDSDLFDPPNSRVRSAAEADIAQPIAVARRVANTQGNKVKRWCFTYNNPTLTLNEFNTFLQSKGADIVCMVMQEEVGANGTHHFQGYLETSSRMYTTGFHTMMTPHRMHVEHAKGTKQSNKTYCSKEEGRVNGPMYINADYFVRRNGQQGARTDHDEFAILVQQEGGVNGVVREQFPGHALRYHRQAADYAEMIRYQEHMDLELELIRARIIARDAGLAFVGEEPRELILYFGPSAVGKTTDAKDYAVRRFNRRAFGKNGKTKWWDGYSAEECVLVDEWRKDLTGDLETFNDMTNGSAYTAETKGGHVSIIAQCMLFTSNRHPTHIFDTSWDEACYRALARRFSEVHWWNDEGEEQVLLNPGREPPLTDQAGHQMWSERSFVWKKFWTWKNRLADESDVVDLANPIGYFSLE